MPRYTVLFCLVSYQSCLKFSIFFQTTNSGLLLLWDVFHLLRVKWWPLAHLLHLSLFRNLPIHKLNLWTPSCLSFIFSICTCLFFEWFLLLGISCHYCRYQQHPSFIAVHLLVFSWFVWASQLFVFSAPENLCSGLAAVSLEVPFPWAPTSGLLFLWMWLYSCLLCCWLVQTQVWCL